MELHGELLRLGVTNHERRREIAESYASRREEEDAPGQFRREDKDVWVADIAEGPIRHTVVTALTRMAGWGSTGPDDDFHGWSITYRVPDSRITFDFPTRDWHMKTRGSEHYWIRSEDVHKFPKFWKVVGLGWRGSGTEVIKRLEHDRSVTRAILDSASPFFTVSIDHDRGCWVLDWNHGWDEDYSEFRRRLRSAGEVKLMYEKASPPAFAWGCYQAIAQHLMDAPIPADE